MVSKVEALMLKAGKRDIRYPEYEHAGVLVVDNFPALGSLTALRFLEWVQSNPEGVISLPTGRTPEYFIKEVQRYLTGWSDKDVSKELSGYGIATKHKPDLSGLYFVQIDEFYPINPRHQNSFYDYVQRYYIDEFGLDPQRALLINCDEIGLPNGADLETFWSSGRVDLGLRYRPAENDRERREQAAIRHVDQWCDEYESRIRELGGIGFFLGGIGPDGHIGFNVRGESSHSTTRLTPVNYETQAAAAGDLGGIEVAENRLVITIGLGTIAYNRNAVAIIMAAGESKAGVVADAIQHPADVTVPASALRGLSGLRFYLTNGAARGLTARGLKVLEETARPTNEQIERVVTELAHALDKRIVDLSEEDYRQDEFASVLLKKLQNSKASVSVPAVNEQVSTSLKGKIEAGMRIRSNATFLHTEPHHDDVMLGYLPSVVRHIRDHSNKHYFATMTSGFNAVTNEYALSLCVRMKEALRAKRAHYIDLVDTGYFRDQRYRDHDVWIYLDGLAASSSETQNEGTLRRFFRNLAFVFDEHDVDELSNRVDELVNYFETQYPGKKDLAHIQQLKGMCREWESACLWGFFGWNEAAVEHLRLGFYKGEVFTEEPTVQRDVGPILELLAKVDPDVVSVAFDPEASGPDTHYKVMQAISAALRMHEKQSGRSDIRVIGYRNIWYRFHPAEANVFVPVSLNMLTLQHHSFMQTYISQKDASFPSYEHKGPFSELAQKIQVEQYNKLATVLGHDFFYEHPSALMRATRGFVFLQEMPLSEFYRHSRALRKVAEND